MPQTKKPRQKTTATTASNRGSQLPDRRAMEAFLSTLDSRKADSTLQEAQDLMYRAWDTGRRQERIALAKRALKVSPLCADAYVLLAEESAKSVKEAKDLYARGVAAGETALGQGTFEEDIGHFWGLLETRPYMRARCGLAQALWALGHRDEAIGHYRDMLRLNPNDNQGIRYIIVAALLATGDDEALHTLLKAYDGDGSPYWTYTRALLAFRASGNTEEARARLAEAVRSNQHVPAFLIGKKKPPVAIPDYITLGGEDEAADYAHQSRDAWTKTPGAIAWLQQTVDEFPPPPDRRSRAIH